MGLGWIGVPAALLLSILFGLGRAHAPAWFQDVAPSVGIDFHHDNGRSGEKYYIETAASGGGWLDFDADGDVDLYLINAGPALGSTRDKPARNALYENRNGVFVDVTEAAGVGDTGYGMGMCVGDIDADGWLDFLVTNYGPDRLYHNRGAGRFEEVGKQAGVADPRWGTSCAFGDLDGDGDLDLYVAHYVEFQFARNPFCGDRARNLRAYCRPDVFLGQRDSLFINRGDGTFQDEAQQRGIASGRDEKGFGVVLSDIDADADLDIYVANDGTMNRLYINDGAGFFTDQALLSGVGLNARGLGESGMGVDIGDVDADGLFDILVTNYSMETNTLYKNRGGLIFDDVTNARGLADASYKYVGWGVAFFDVDNDGDLDLSVANGHAIDNIEQFEPALQYRQPNQLFENDGRGNFHEVSQLAGSAWTTERVSRGLAVGDWNNDGHLDLLVTNTNDPPELLENQPTTDNHWIGVQLKGAEPNPFAIGAQLTLTAGHLRLLREVRGGSSFLTQQDLRAHFGLGPHTGKIALHIRWPDGRIQHETTDQLDRYWEITYAPREVSTPTPRVP